MTNNAADRTTGDPTGSSKTGGTARGTQTASFGTGARESHDSSAFYARFVPPEISDDDTVVHPDDRPVRNATLLGTAEDLLADERNVADNSVALVVTSPPYFVGKTYEEAMGKGHVPAEYNDHLANLHRVFELCVDKLEPGGRIAVNVANLGRKPYRSQAADVLRIFEDLKLLLRGEIIWRKGDGMNSSTAWGSFQRPSSPVFRDLTERVIIASKGRFDRARTPRERQEQGLPSDGSISRDEFMSATKDVWDLPSESATRVGHPAPFPVALPKRLIDLFTYRNDLVLDPYMGSGTTAVAAIRTEREFIGCEAESKFADLCDQRAAEERARLDGVQAQVERFRVHVPPGRAGDLPADADPAEHRAAAVHQGKRAEDIAEAVLVASGFTVTHTNKKLRCGPEIKFAATDALGDIWHFDLTGGFTNERDGGLRRADAVWKSLGKAAVRRTDDEVQDQAIPLVLLTTGLPVGGVGAKALRVAMADEMIVDAVEILSDEGQRRLGEYGTAGRAAARYDSPAAPVPHDIF